MKRHEGLKRLHTLANWEINYNYPSEGEPQMEKGNDYNKIRN